MRRSAKYPILLAATAGLMLSVGCSSSPPRPDDQLAVTEASISEAESAEAREYAPLQLKLANDKLAAAKQAIEQGDNVRARRLLEQAEVEAELAVAKAQSANARKSAQEVEESIDTLREEVQRGQRR